MFLPEEYAKCSAFECRTWFFLLRLIRQHRFEPSSGVVHVVQTGYCTAVSVVCTSYINAHMTGLTSIGLPASTSCRVDASRSPTGRALATRRCCGKQINKPSRIVAIIMPRPIAHDPQSSSSVELDNANSRFRTTVQLSMCHYSARILPSTTAEGNLDKCRRYFLRSRPVSAIDFVQRKDQTIRGHDDIEIQSKLVFIFPSGIPTISLICSREVLVCIKISSILQYCGNTRKQCLCEAMCSEKTTC